MLENELEQIAICRAVLASAGWCVMETPSENPKFLTLQAREVQGDGYAIASCVRGTADGYRTLINMIKLPMP
jgi:hypothetical protein